MATHKDLKIWKNSISLVKDVYELANKFPAHERYALSAQIRRSSISIPSNIAEGAARSGDKEFIRFLYISIGSLSELETQLMIAKEIGYIVNPKIFQELDNLRMSILSFIKYLKGLHK
ncbi:MAG TPA: four helix bundle protein [Cytophagales bacterium]|jgi:four helix bundle protein|nr:four helix bundle protein [Cytophagales bacterium]